jgi:hypothetical protein
VRAHGHPPMPMNRELDALARDLDELSAAEPDPPPAEIADARDALRKAADAVSRNPRAVGPDSERALTLARMAIDRAGRAVGTVRPRSAWQDALRAPAAAPATDRPSPTRLKLDGDVELVSEIPDSHPEKEAIETSVAGAFAGVKGRWRVAILVQPHAAWWGLRVEGNSICWTGTLEGPDEQSPEYLAGRVREAVRLGVMQAALPHHRHRG